MGCTCGRCDRVCLWSPAHSLPPPRSPSHVVVPQLLVVPQLFCKQEARQSCECRRQCYAFYCNTTNVAVVGNEICNSFTNWLGAGNAAEIWQRNAAHGRMPELMYGCLSAD